MIYIKLWMIIYGVVIFAWLLFACGLGFLIWTGVVKENKKEKFITGLFLISLTFALFVYLSLPAQWTILSNIGEL